MQAIVIPNVIGLVLLGTLYGTCVRPRGKRHTSDLYLRVLMIIIAGCCVTDTIAWYLEGRPEAWARPFNYACNIYCYLATTICSYLWVLYVDARLRPSDVGPQRQFPVLLVPTIALAIANITSVWTNLMFVIDEHNVYARTPLSYLNYAMSLISLFYSVFLKFQFERRYWRMSFLPLWQFLVPVTVSAVIQALMYGTSLAWVGCCVGLTAIQLSQQRELAYVDDLTGLYNRAYLRRIMPDMGRRRGHSAGILVRLEHLREINEAFSYAVGNDALRRANQLIAYSAPADAQMLRIADTEFLVLVHSAGEISLRASEAAIRRAAQEFNRSERAAYDLSFTLGHSLYLQGVDTPEGFLKRMSDQALIERGNAAI